MMLLCNLFMISKDQHNRVENNEYNDLHAALVDEIRSTTLDKPWSNEWLEKSFLHQTCWLTIEHYPLCVDNFNRYRGNTRAIPCIDKSAIANPKLHCLHFLRHLSLCDGAMHLCIVLLCNNIFQLTFLLRLVELFSTVDIQFGCSSFVLPSSMLKESNPCLW